MSSHVTSVSAAVSAEDAAQLVALLCPDFLTELVVAAARLTTPVYVEYSTLAVRITCHACSHCSAMNRDQFNCSNPHCVVEVERGGNKYEATSIFIHLRCLVSSPCFHLSATALDDEFHSHDIVSAPQISPLWQFYFSEFLEKMDALFCKVASTHFCCCKMCGRLETECSFLR